jgi:tetratricopeptide (TPR) repeat protein
LSAAVFISYRREDAGGHAGRLLDRLALWFDTEALFFDTAAIQPGEAFPQRLIDGIANAACILVLIGPNWLAELNRRASLSEPDYVRLEVEHALGRLSTPASACVIPVLMGGAGVLSKSDFADPVRGALAPLLSLDHLVFQGKNDDWNHQFVRLRERLETLPGVPRARFRLPHGAAPLPFRTNGQSVSWHFSDANDRLGALRRALTNSGAAAVVSPAAVYGMGGVGKTQLALRYSHLYRDAYAGVWWLRAETDETLQLDALDACRAVGAELPEGTPPALALKRWLEAAAGVPAWLLVFDNAEDPARLRAWLPERGGHHLLITSRNPAWSGIAQPVAIGVWSPEQGVAFLERRLHREASPADRAVLRDLAQALGGLPLALEQAASFLDDTGMSATAYVEQVRRNETAPLLLDEGRPATGYERSVLSTLSMAFPRLPEDASLLLRLLALCAPEPVPESLFVDRPHELPPALAYSASNPVLWEKALGALRRLGLVERTTDASPRESAAPEGHARTGALLLHRLTQEVARHRLSDSSADADNLLRLLRTALPPDAASPANWPAYTSLAPHVLFVERFGTQFLVDRRALAWTLDRIATYIQYRLALYGTAGAIFERALGLNRGDLGDEHPDTLRSMDNLALTLLNQGNLDEARALQEQVLAAKRRVQGDDHADTLVSMGNLASTLSGQGDLDGARALEERVLAAMRRIRGEEHHQTLTAMNNLATTLFDQGDLTEARTLQGQVLAAMRRIRGDEHPETLTSQDNLALTLLNQGNLNEARALQEQTLAARRRVQGDEHPQTLISMGNLALTLSSQGDWSGARALEEQGLALMRRVLGDEHPDTLAWCGNLASTLFNQGDLSGARTLGERVLAATRRVLGDEHPKTLTAMHNLAVALSEGGEVESALELMKAAASGRSAKLGANHPDALISAQSLALMRQRLAESAPRRR